MAAAARARRAGAPLALVAVLLAPTVGCAPAGVGPQPVRTTASPASAPAPADFSRSVAAPAGTAPQGDRTPPYPELLPRTTGDALLTLTLGRVVPAISTPGASVDIDVTITNQGLTDAAPVLRARLGPPVLARADLDASTAVERTAVVSDPVPGPTIAPGASATVRLTIPPERLAQDPPYGVCALLVQAEEGAGSAVVRTYLPFEHRKEYEPLRLAVALPVTVDPDPKLTGADPAAAEAAWARATSPGSRLDRILTGTGTSPVTYAIDPTVLGPAGAEPDQTAPSATGGPTPSSGPPPSTQAGTAPTQTGPDGPAETTPPSSPARDGLATRLASLARTHPIWALPAQDPDVTELLRSDAGADTLPRILAPDGRIVARLSPGSLTRVAWPHAALSAEQVRRVSAAYGSGWNGPLVLPLQDTAQPGSTGDAARRFDDGPGVVAYDETLSRLLADATGSPASAGPGLTQRFLAETMTVLLEYPGRPRHLLAVTPRDFDPDPATLAALLRTAESTPWMRLVSTDDLVGAARHNDAPTALAPADPASRPDPLPSGGSPLDAPRVDAVESDLRRIDGLARILPPDSTTPASVHAAALSLLSTRWRGEGVAWQTARTATRARVDALLQGVSVVDSQINFFADSGTLQVTVVNTLDADVRDVQLHLIPPVRMPRLRLPSTPYVLAIAAHSRATVKVPVEALAAGPTVVSAQVTSPDGTRLGAQDATLAVQVQPSTGWLVVGIGGAAATVFIVGLFRTIRRNRPRVSAQDLEEVDLE